MAIVGGGDRQKIEPGLRSLEDRGGLISFVDAEGRPAAQGSAGGVGDRQ